jgi:hypothetical protein
MANRFGVYSVAIVSVVATLVIANSIITLTNAHTAAQTIKSNTSAVPAYQVTNLGQWHGRLPMARTVVTSTTVDLKANDYAANYSEEAVGGYLWGTGVIVVKPEASQMVLAHEYGHALTYEYLVSISGNDMTAATSELFGSVLDFGRTSDISELPTALRDVATEYQSTDPDIYGSTYYTERLTEYLAQSFARYCSGQSVPPVTEKWLTELDNAGGR